MNLTSSAETITCARPGCGADTTPAESTYVDGCGNICPDATRTSSAPARRGGTTSTPVRPSPVLTGRTCRPVSTQHRPASRLHGCDVIRYEHRTSPQMNIGQGLAATVRRCSR